MFSKYVMLAITLAVLTVLAKVSADPLPVADPQRGGHNGGGQGGHYAGGQGGHNGGGPGGHNGGHYEGGFGGNQGYHGQHGHHYG